MEAVVLPNVGHVPGLSMNLVLVVVHVVLTRTVMADVSVISKVHLLRDRLSELGTLIGRA